MLDDELYELTLVEKYVKLNQQRIYVNCILRLPTEVREKTPRDVVQRCHGDFLLGFSSYPFKGFKFPYENQVWEIAHEPIQFPARYKSPGYRHPAIALCKHLISYEMLDEALDFLIGRNRF